jgi:hypothetical protein
MLAWWDGSYLSGGNIALQRRFADEVRASLPAVATSDRPLDIEGVYAAVTLQRLRLHQDQQVPEWIGDVVR